MISLSSASVPGAVGREQQAVTLREVGARRRGQWDGTKDQRKGVQAEQPGLMVAVGQAGPHIQSWCWAGPSGLRK